jgi:peptide/nickel transport system permease protein
MINIISQDQDILQNHLNVWVPAGICIVVAVLGFNFIGDGLRDALDPKARR